MHDVVIVGGGPAGLSAALVLGRSRRRVLVCDSGRPRNARSRGMHGYLTRDGIDPAELLRIARRELADYDVELRDATVVGIERDPAGFVAVLEAGERVPAQAVLLATGVRDTLPDIPGFADCFGISVHHCPYCDGWEVRDKTISVVGAGASPAGLALSLKTWSPHIVACSNGTRMRPAHRRQLTDRGVTIETRRIARLEHVDGWVRQLMFADGGTLSCDAVFFTAPQQQHSDLAQRLGCEFTSKGAVKTNLLGQTCVPGIYVVGDASRDVQFVIVAAAEGAKAGVAINKALQEKAGLTAHAAT